MSFDRLTATCQAPREISPQLPFSPPISEEKNFEHIPIHTLNNELLNSIFHLAVGLKREEGGNEFENEDQSGDQKTFESIWLTCRHWSHVLEEGVLNTVWKKIVETPFFKQFPVLVKEEQQGISPTRETFRNLSSMMLSRRTLIFPADYSKHKQQLLDESLQKLWIEILKVVNFGTSNNLQSAEEIRAFLNDPNKATDLNQITKLNFANQDLKLLPPEIYSLTFLQELTLNDNQIVKVPEEIGDFRRLRVLYLNKNLLRVFPNGIARNRILRELHLSFNQLTEIPKDVCYLFELVKLDLSHNQISEIPKKIGKLDKLEQFYLNNNQIAEIPAGIGKLTRLTQLNLSSNLLREIPKQMGKLYRLKELRLNNNQLQEIPKEIRRLDELQLLHLNDNQIREIPEEIGVEVPPSFKYDARVELLKEIGCLCELRELQLSNNQLIKIPKEIQCLFRLIKLDLSDNLLTEIPKEIGNLCKLRELQLSNNQLTLIPREIKNLRELQDLDLIYNQISTIPSDISRLAKLEQLHLNYFTTLVRLNKDLKSLSGFICEPEQNYQSQSRDKIYNCQTPFASFCQALQQNENDGVLIEKFSKLSDAMKKEIKLGSRAQSEELIIKDKKSLHRTLITLLSKNFKLLTQEKKTRIHNQVWELAGKPQGKNWGAIRSTEYIIRLIDAWAFCCEVAPSFKSRVVIFDSDE